MLNQLLVQYRIIDGLEEVRSLLMARASCLEPSPEPILEPGDEPSRNIITGELSSLKILLRVCIESYKNGSSRVRVSLNTLEPSLFSSRV